MKRGNGLAFSVLFKNISRDRASLWNTRNSSLYDTLNITRIQRDANAKYYIYL